MPATILSIGTAVPETRVPQSQIRDVFAAQDGIGRLGARLIHAAFDHSAIEYRHTVIPDLHTPGGGLFLNPSTGVRRPTTAERNAVYRREAPPLFAAAAGAALERAKVEPSEVTHVVTVSCTGFFAPGPDFRLVRDLGLRPEVERFHIGFMGCAAAFPALRAAARICEALPDAVVLVACAELCTLHLRSSSEPDQIVSSAVFADGAAAAVLASDAARAPGPHLVVESFLTTITDDGEKDMDWTIGDEGFEMILTPEVPRIVGREIRAVVDAASGGAPADAWAVHPGGRSILDRVQAGLDLPDRAMDPSRAVLRDYGNMSSATVLFILESLLADDTLGDGARVMGLAFGPGLTVETGRFTRRDAS